MILAIVSKYESRIVDGDATNISLSANIIYIGTTEADRTLIGENNNADVPVDLTTVNNTPGLRVATAAAARTWATQRGFAVDNNNVLCQSYQTA